MAGCWWWSGSSEAPGFRVECMAFRVFCSNRPGWRRATFSSLLASPVFPPPASPKSDSSLPLLPEPPLLPESTLDLEDVFFRFPFFFFFLSRRSRERPRRPGELSWQLVLLVSLSFLFPARLARRESFRPNLLHWRSSEAARIWRPRFLSFSFVLSSASARLRLSFLFCRSRSRPCLQPSRDFGVGLAAVASK